MNAEVGSLCLSARYVRELGRLLRPFGSGRLNLTFLSAYIDESGVGSGETDMTAAGLVFSSGGFIAGADDWEAFSEKWVRILVAEGVTDPPELHMKDFEHSRGQFAGWDKDRKARVLGSLIDLINGIGTMGHADVASRGVPNDWDQTHIGHIYSRENRYYAMGTGRCIVELAAMADAFLGVEEKVSFVVGLTPYSGAVTTIYEQMKNNFPKVDLRRRLGAISFESPSFVPPLQAADLLAYESRKKFVDFKQSESFRRSIVRLESGLRVTYSLNDIGSLEPVFKKVLTDPEVVAAWKKREAKKGRTSAKRNKRRGR